jgi:hypothetical protein
MHKQQENLSLPFAYSGANVNEVEGVRSPVRHSVCIQRSPGALVHQHDGICLDTARLALQTMLCPQACVLTVHQCNRCCDVRPLKKCHMQ